ASSAVPSPSRNSSRGGGRGRPPAARAPPPAPPPRAPPPRPPARAQGAPRLGQPERVESHAAAHVEAARARRKTETRDDGARRRLVEAVHPLQRDGEGNRLGRAAHAGLARTLTMTLVATATVR